MEQTFFSGSECYGAGTDMESTGYSAAMGGYRRDDDEYAEKWMHGQDPTDPNIGRAEYYRDQFAALASPASSLYNAYTPSGFGDSSGISSVARGAPSGMHRRPAFPPSSGLVWDIFKQQCKLLQPYEIDEKVRPPGFREYWAMPKKLAEVTPPLLCSEDIAIVATPSDAEALYDVLKKKGYLSNNIAYKAPTAAVLEKALMAEHIHLSEYKLKQLEWLLGVAYDLCKLDRSQFEMVHGLLPRPVWTNYYFEKWPRLGGWFVVHDKSRGPDVIVDARINYWDVERDWQKKQYGPAHKAALEAAAAVAAARPTSPVDALKQPSPER